MWDLLTGEAEASAGDATNEATDSNIDGPNGRMVRMMKRSIQVSLYNVSQSLNSKTLSRQTEKENAGKIW